MKIFIAALLVALSATAATNTLTPEEKSAGWILLFDGKSMKGWVDPAKHNPPGDGWTIEDGCLKSKGKPRYREDLFTTQSFTDFELVFDWRISPGGNSGIKYRIQDHFFVLPAKPNEAFAARVQRSVEQPLCRPAGGEDYVVGFEYQLTDDIGNTDAKSDGRHISGALYDMVPPGANVGRPVGEFNHSRIVLRGNHVEHWLNGTKVVDSSLDSPVAMAAIEKRWGKTPSVRDMLAKQPKKDCPISLQNHGDEAWFRDIKIRKLK